MSFLDDFFRKKSATLPPEKDGSFSRKDNTAFLNAMNSLGREDTPAARRALYEAMPTAWFFTPTPPSESKLKIGENISDGNTRLSFPIIQDQTGRKIVPTFTDVDALSSWAGEGSFWVALQGLPFFQAVIKTDIDEIAINPPLPGKPVIRPGGRITRSELAVLAEGLIPEPYPGKNLRQMRVAKQQKVLIGMPAEMPRQELFDALSDTATAHAVIRGLYFCSLAFEQSAPHNAVAIELATPSSRQDVEKAVAALGSAIQPWLSKNEFRLLSHPWQLAPRHHQERR
jgi:hypothetical protein